MAAKKGSAVKTASKKPISKKNTTLLQSNTKSGRKSFNRKSNSNSDDDSFDDGEDDADDALAEEDDDADDDVFTNSSRVKRRGIQQRDDSSDDSDAPEEVRTSAEELARLRAAFEQHYGQVAADTDAKANKKLKGAAAKKAAKKAAKADFAVDEQNLLDPAVLAGLDENALAQAIDIGPAAENAVQEDQEINWSNKGLTIDKNARNSVRIVEGNTEVHILSRKWNPFNLFVPSTEGSAGNVDPLAALLEQRHRINYSKLAAQKTGKAARVFVGEEGKSADSVKQLLGEQWGGKGSGTRRNKATIKKMRKAIKEAKEGTAKLSAVKR